MRNFKIIDSYISSKEKEIFDKQMLLTELEILIKKGKARIIMLESDNIGKFTIGISEKLGFIEYQNNSGCPPYLIAMQKRAKSTGKFIEFDAGGTPTPVKKKYCISIKLLLEIVTHFFETGELSEKVNWQEE